MSAHIEAREKERERDVRSRSGTIDRITSSALGASTSGASTSNGIDYVRGGAAAAHKRGLSGSLASRFNFFRSSGDASTKDAAISGAATALNRPASSYAAQPSTFSVPVQAVRVQSPTAGSQGGTVFKAIATVGAARSRKGSLRKNILKKGSLKDMGARAESSSSSSVREEHVSTPRTETRTGSMSVVQPRHVAPNAAGLLSPPRNAREEDEINDDDDDYPTPRASYDSGSYHHSLEAGGMHVSPSRGLGLSLSSGSDEGLLAMSIPSTAASSQISLPASNDGRELLSTDDEDSPAARSRAGSSLDGHASSPPAQAGPAMSKKASLGDSYFPAPPPSPSTSSSSLSISRRSRSLAHTAKLSSPLASLPLTIEALAAAAAAGGAPDAPHSYDETAFYGYVILGATWVVFVTGIGSCAGLWGWAWDVGETPYAPPELEDDPTLPISGYYPALIVLTGIMAWVWVLAAWVGVKEFKHARGMGEEG